LKEIGKKGAPGVLHEEGRKAIFERRCASRQNNQKQTKDPARALPRRRTRTFTSLGEKRTGKKHYPLRKNGQATGSPTLLLP